MMKGNELQEKQTAMVEVLQVSKSYGDLKAVDGVSFSAYPGEVFGLLGPNGAGKTTTLEMIEGLRKPEEGRILVNGHDVATDLRKVKEIIGVQLQSTSLYNKIKVGEALRLYGGYYRKRRSVRELLQLVSLEDKEKSFHQELSGGQQQRLALALTMVNDPLVVFLDEPTTGLDPQARRNLWDIIARMKSDDKTVILTTHYMEEAERLCDRIAIMDHGRLIARGTPGELVAELDVDSCLEFNGNGEISVEELQKLPRVSKISRSGERIELFCRRPTQTLIALMRWAEGRGIEIDNLHVRRPTLEDLFIELTGRSLRE